jgi:hypothetical protein
MHDEQIVDTGPSFIEREGSTVRVRQRACKSRANRGFSVERTCTGSSVRCVWSRFMELSGPRPSSRQQPQRATSSGGAGKRTRRCETTRKDEPPAIGAARRFEYGGPLAALRHLKRNRTPRAAARIPRFRLNVLQRSFVQSRRRESRTSRGRGATRRCQRQRVRAAGAMDQQSRTR